MLESVDAVRMGRPLPVEKAIEDDTLLAFGMNGELLTPDHGFPVRAVVSGWAAVASVKWLGCIHVSETPLSSPWNLDKHVLTGGEFGEGREPVTVRGVKSALRLSWLARLPAGRHLLCGRSWSGYGAISRVEYSVDGGTWHGARLFGKNVPGRGRGGASGGLRSLVGMRSGSGQPTRRATPSRARWGGMI